MDPAALGPEKDAGVVGLETEDGAAPFAVDCHRNKKKEFQAESHVR
jgi:hypothetical protein